MKPYKRGKRYHIDFTVHGQRYRQSLDTTDWREAQRKAKDKIAQAKKGRLSPDGTAPLGKLGFTEAIERFLTVRKMEIQCPKHEEYLAKPLRAFYRQKRLNTFTDESVRAYQSSRMSQGKKPQTVNLEVRLLLRLLKRARLRHLLGDDLKMLSNPKSPRQMLTAEEKLELFDVASREPRWQTAFCAALLTANTTMRPIELKRLCWVDIDTSTRTLVIRKSKTKAGTRIIPLNDEAWSAICALRRRSTALGAERPEHFVFHRQWPKIDPTRPMRDWRSAWRSLRNAAGKPNLRYYDLRHLAITELCEAGVPEAVIRELAGHVDPDMMRWYSHPRLAARRAAVEALSTIGKKQQKWGSEEGYVTNSVTKALPGKSEVT